MREPAVPAADRKMPASNGDIMKTVHMAVPAICGFFKVPDIITSDFGKCTRLRYILDTRDKDPCCTTIVTRYFGLVRDSFNDLICYLSAVIAVGSIPGKDELVAHARYWMRMSSLICCMTYSRCGPSTIKQYFQHEHGQKVLENEKTVKKSFLGGLVVAHTGGHTTHTATHSTHAAGGHTAFGCMALG
jgi:hypothetical protein